MIKKANLVAVLFVAATTFGADSELVTTPERTNFAETSLYADVANFVNSAVSSSSKLRARTFGTSAGGLDLPLVVVSTGGIATPEEARLYNLPAVLLAANIHAGEVEGKEALQMLLRDVVDALGVASISEWQAEQLVADGRVSQALRKVGYQTELTWCQPYHFRPKRDGHEAQRVILKEVRIKTTLP